MCKPASLSASLLPTCAPASLSRCTSRLRGICGSGVPAPHAQIRMANAAHWCEHKNRSTSPRTRQFPSLLPPPHPLFPATSLPGRAPHHPNRPLAATAPTSHGPLRPARTGAPAARRLVGWWCKGSGSVWGPKRVVGSRRATCVTRRIPRSRARAPPLDPPPHCLGHTVWWEGCGRAW